MSKHKRARSPFGNSTMHGAKAGHRTVRLDGTKQLSKSRSEKVFGVIRPMSLQFMSTLTRWVLKTSIHS